MVFLIQQTMIYAIPLMIVALAGIFAERSGVINLALEGIMIFGAFIGVLFVRTMQENQTFTQEQGQLVNCRQLAEFFATEIGRKLAAGADCLREFKFSILDDGRHYGEGLEGEQVLLQGVVDCALLEEKGITIVDFKTDAVTEQTLPTAVQRYRSQVQTYAEALSRIYEQPIIGKYLYFFHRGQLVSL